VIYATANLVAFALPASDNTSIADVASDSLVITRNPNNSVGPEDLDALITAFITGC